LALKIAWKQSGDVKTIKSYTATNPRPFSPAMDGEVITIDDNFFDNGQSLAGGLR
jgi:hypothetical protein